MALQSVQKAVVGIDFGTSNCGVAYALMPKNPDEIDIKSLKPKMVPIDDSPSNDVKVPTTIVLDKDEPHNFVGFGKGVMNEFDPDDHLLFYHFKMQLYDDPNRTHLVPDIGETQVKTVLVIARCLEYFKEKFLHYFEETTGDQISVDEVLWVVTVPAIWDDGAKVVMQQAATDAGLIDNTSSPNLSIALEPESAAVEVNYTQQSVFHLNETFAVVDCGGGTVDTTILKILNTPPNLDLKQLAKASGGDWGSTRIDKAMIELLGDILKYRGGGRSEATHNDDDPKTWVRPPSLNSKNTNMQQFEFLQDSFEQAKTSFGHQGEKPVRMNVSAFIDDIKLLHGSLQNAIDGYNEGLEEDSQIKVATNTSIILPPAVMKKLFQVSLEKLVRHIKEYILGKKYDDRQGVDKLILTGGFSASKPLVKAVQDAVQGTTTTVLTSPNNSLGIVFGAVMNAMQPRTISSRVLRVTYGMAVSVPWVEGQPRDNLFTHQGKEYVPIGFSKLIDEGTHVGYDFCIEKFTSPVQGYSGIRFEIHCAPQDVKYTTDPTCTKLGAFVYSGLDASLPPDQNRVKVKMFFGRSYVQLTAEKDGEIKTMDVSLLVHN